MTDDESNIFWLEFSTPKNEICGGRYKSPRVFKEQGVAMMTTILKSCLTIETSIAITYAFVKNYVRNSKLKILIKITDIITDNSLYNKNLLYSKLKSSSIASICI